MSTNEPPRRPKGRPRLYPQGEPVQRVHMSLDSATIAWASQQPGGISGTVRRCLEQMQKRADERE